MTYARKSMHLIVSHKMCQDSHKLVLYVNLEVACSFCEFLMYGKFEIKEGKLLHCKGIFHKVGPPVRNFTE